MILRSMRSLSAAAPAHLAMGQAPATIDLALIRKLTNVADINRLLHDTLAKERTVDQELEQLLGKRVEVEQGLLGLQASTAEVRTLWPITEVAPAGPLVKWLRSAIGACVEVEQGLLGRRASRMEVRATSCACCTLGLERPWCA